MLLLLAIVIPMALTKHYEKGKESDNDDDDLKLLLILFQILMLRTHNEKAIQERINQSLRREAHAATS